MTECINTKPVTCRKGRKVPFAVTHHKYMMMINPRFDGKESIYNKLRKLSL